jgi:hypothetical protein
MTYLTLLLLAWPAQHRAPASPPTPANFPRGASGRACFVANTPPEGAPTSQPTTRPAIAENVERLVGELRSPRFAAREQAQKRLASYGEAAIPYLLEHLTAEDPELSRRVADIVGRPRDPALRAEVAVRLLATADPDWIERGVYMLFEDPLGVCDRFLNITRDAEGAQRIIFMAVKERLVLAKRRHEIHAKRYARLIKEKPELAEKERLMNAETDRYDAEAAYWTAYEGLLEYEEQFSPRDPGRRDEKAPPASAPAEGVAP